MEFLIIIPIVLAVISWLVAAGSWFLSLGHLAEGVTAMSMMFNGIKAFDPDSYTDEGKKHQGRFLKGTGAFFLFVLVSIACGVLLTPS